jgi:hypothetical protein
MDILSFTDGEDHYASRKKVNKARYKPLLEELVKFAQARAEEQHQLGVGWFLKTGIVRLNEARREQGEAPIPCDLSENPVKKWLQDNHPELREAFRR